MARVYVHTFVGFHHVKAIVSPAHLIREGEDGVPKHSALAAQLYSIVADIFNPSAPVLCFASSSVYFAVFIVRLADMLRDGT